MRVRGVGERKVTFHDLKSGKEVESVFMPEQVARRLNSYFRKQGWETETNCSTSATAPPKTRSIGWVRGSASKSILMI